MIKTLVLLFLLYCLGILTALAYIEDWSIDEWAQNACHSILSEYNISNE